MRLDMVRELLFLADSMNFTHAAASLNITQSSLSKHMCELEERTGLRLFNHSVARPALTETGKLFVQEFSLIVSEIDIALKKCKDLQKSEEQPLRFHVAQLSVVMSSIYDAVRQYCRSYPNTIINFTDIEAYKSVQEAIRLDFIDIGFDCVSQCGSYKEYENDMKSKGFYVLPLHTEPMVVWGKKDNALLEEKFLSFDQLKNAPIITSSGHVFDSIQRALVQIFESEQAIPRFKKIHLENANNAIPYFLLTNLDEGFLLFTTSKMVSDGHLSSREDVICRAVDDPRFLITIYAIAKNDNTRAIDFLSFVQESFLGESTGNVPPKAVECLDSTP